MDLNNVVNKIFNDEWENVFPQIPNDSIDLIITSPPYNIDLGQSEFKDAYDSHNDNMSFDSYLTWMSLLFCNCHRILKQGGRLCINVADASNGSIPTHAYFISMLLGKFINSQNVNLEKQFEYITTIVWDKGQMGSSTAWGSWLSPNCPSFPTQFEYIIIVGKGTKYHNGEKDSITVTRDNFITNSRALWRFAPETKMREYGHPAMFPEELPRRLIDQLSYQNDIVLDPFNGLGTTTVVAKQMGRQYIGIEKSKIYYDKSIERMASIPLMVSGVPSWMS